MSAKCREEKSITENVSVTKPDISKLKIAAPLRASLCRLPSATVVLELFPIPIEVKSPVVTSETSFGTSIGGMNSAACSFALISSNDDITVTVLILFKGAKI